MLGNGIEVIHLQFSGYGSLGLAVSHFNESTANRGVDHTFFHETCAIPLHPTTR